MKSQFFRKVVLFSVIGLFLSTMIVVAQDKDNNKKKNEPQLQPDGSYKTNEFNPADRPDDSYLAKFHARDIVVKLVRRNLEQIYLLNVIKSNFKKKEYGQKWDQSYKEVYAGYKKALDYYYKRNIIYARHELEKNRREINKLLKTINMRYQADSKKMLEECAEKILERHLDATTKSDPNKHKELKVNEMRLHIAYGQYDDAVNSAIDKKYHIAIYHLRVAKTYGIKILQDLSDDPEKVKKQYEVIRADNLNRIFEEPQQSKNTNAGGN